jgi:hypothetical protein
MKNKEKTLLVTKHLIRVPDPIDVSYNDGSRNKAVKNIDFNVNVYFKKGTVKAVRIQLPFGWLTNELTDPIRSELLEFIRPLNPLYKNLTLKNVLPE